MMDSSRKTGAFVLAGIVTFLAKYYLVMSVSTGSPWYEFVLEVAALPWWSIFAPLFLLFLFPEKILLSLGAIGKQIIRMGGGLLIALNGYLSTLSIMFWKEKKGIYGNSTFMSDWDQWWHWYNTSNHGWSVGAKSIPREDKTGGDTTYSGLLVLGPPQVGKSSAIALMSILRFISKKGVHSDETGEVNLFVNDPSGELFDKSSAAALQHGYNVLRLCTNKEDRAKSIRFNPLRWCKGDTTEIGKLADTLISMQEGGSTNSTSKYFMNGAKTMLKAILVATSKEEEVFANLPNAYRLMLEFASDPETIGKAIEMRLSDDETLRLQWTAINERPEKELGGIIGTVENALAFTGDKTIAYLLSGNDFELDDLRNTKLVLYSQFDENDRLFKPVNALLLSYAFGRCMKKRKKKDKLYRPVLFFLEECYTLGYVPGLSEFAGNCRKYKCGLLLIFQGLGQLESLYGKKAKAITDGVRSMVIFRGLDPEYYEKIEKAIGYTTAKDENGMERRIPLISVQDMEKMGKSTCIIKIAGEQPIKTKFKKYYQLKRYRRLAEMGAIEQESKDISDIPYILFFNPEENIVKGYDLETNQNVGQQSDKNVHR